MTEPRLARLYVAAGSFGGEVVLMLSLPALGRRFGAAEVALLGLAVVAANAGKLLGCLRIDAAITDAEAALIGAVHALALAAAAATAAVLALVAVLRPTGSLLAHWDPALGMALWAAFLGGAVQQATTMRLLRDDRPRTFALLKALPSASLVVFALGGGVHLLGAYELAFLLVIFAAAVLHLRWPAAGLRAFTARVRGQVGTVRSYVAHGAPASALDAANIFLLSLATIAIAGTESAGQATQLQRLALGPALVTAMILSQNIWRQRFGTGTEAARASFRHTILTSTAAGAVSATIASALVFTPVGTLIVPISAGRGWGVLACLAPVLSVYVGTPLTVYFFKRQRMALYAALQVGLLGCLGLTWLLATPTPPDGAGRSLGLFALALASLALTVTVSRRAVLAPAGAR